jgi:hypothetical protein
VLSQCSWRKEIFNMQILDQFLEQPEGSLLSERERYELLEIVGNGVYSLQKH